MPNLFASKFVRLLQTLDEAEIRAFEAWLRSPWCNTNRNLPRLLGRLRKYYPDFDDEKLTKEKLFRQVLPGGKFSHRRMNNLLSEAYLAAEKFLAFQSFAQQERLQKQLLAEEFQARHLDEWFFKCARKEIAGLEEKRAKGREDHLGLFLLHSRIYHHPNQSLRMQPGSSAILEMSKQLDLLYALEKAAIINEMTSRSRLIKGETYEVQTELKKWEAASEGIQHPAIELYRMRFAFTEENRIGQYQSLREAMLDKMGQLSEKDQKLHLLSLLNDTIQFIKSGQLDITESLPLYQLGLQTGLLMHQGKLTRNTYTTIVVASNTKGTFDFTARFIKNYTDCLDEDIREDCLHWALAHTAYWQKNLEQCLDILQEHAFKVPYFQMIGRVLHTQVYFDLYLKDDSCQSYLFSFFDAFEKWLSREKVWSKAQRTSFLRFVQKCRQLARFYGDIDFEPRKVETLLEGQHNIQAFNWLNRKKEEVLRLRMDRLAGG